MNVLGISFGFHESAACLVQDGRLVFACAEERLSRKKQDSSFPVRAIQAALDFAGLRAPDVDHVAFAWPRPPKSHAYSFGSILLGRVPFSFTHCERVLVSFAKAQRHKGGEVDYLRSFGAPKGGFHFISHHRAHALSAYCMSGFDEVALLVVDGSGARRATSLWSAAGENINLIEQYDFPNSLGLFYARITEMLGFQPFSDEWKVMGLAAYGEPTFDLSPIIRSNGEGYWVAGRRLFGRGDSRKDLEELVGLPRKNASEMEERYRNLASSAQQACERAMLSLVRRVTRLTGCRKLCLAGGVALNCKANGELLRSGLIDDIYIQPAAGDDGACIGAAFAVYPKLGLPLPRQPLGHSYLGTEFSDRQIEEALRTYKLPYRRVENPAREAAERLAANRLVGWFQGRMEFGPRALGNRSILANPRYAGNTDRVNEAVKFREGWRPFAPSVLKEKAHLYFDDFKSSPYMILSFWANKTRACQIPAVVHVDGSCRVQSVDREVNPVYYDLIDHFHQLTSLPVILNTSFNLKGDAIVCAPKEAIETFYTSGLDDLIIGHFALSKC